MQKTRGTGFWVMAAILAFTAAGCAKAPVDEQKAAETAKNKATLAQAENYATEAMNVAMKRWADAEAAMQAKSYQAAKQGYIAAAEAFVEAEKGVDVGKTAMIQANLAALNMLKTGWAEANSLAKRKVMKMQASVKISWENDSKVIMAAIKSAANSATSPAELKKSLEEANHLLEKWLANLRK